VTVQEDDYRQRYNSLLREFTELEDQQDALERLIKNAITRLLFAVDKAYPELNEPVASLRDQLRNADSADFDINAVGQSLGDLGEQIRELEALSPPPAQPNERQRPAADTRAQIQATLPLLLDRIAITEQLEDRRTRLIQTLEDPNDDTLPSILIDRAAGLVNDMRQQIEREKTDLTRFLAQVTQALADIDEHTQHQIVDAEHQRAAREQLNRSVEDQVGSISEDLSNAPDLDTLKSTLNERIERIRSHLSEFHQSEEDRLAKVEQDNQRLRERVISLEKHTRLLQTRLKSSEEKMLRDNLTGIPNRLAFNERIKIEIARSKREEHPLTLAIWDIDHFKRINDEYGHQAGDKALIIVSKTLMKLIREIDMVARFGGEEFVMLLPETDAEGAKVVAERIRNKLARTVFRYQEQKLSITISCGLAQFKPGESIESVFSRADKALYQAKEQGRNQCVLAQ